MSEQPVQPAGPEGQVEALAEQFLEQLQAGQSPDRRALVQAHPEVAEALDRRLSLVEMMFRVARAAVGDAGRADQETGDLPAPGAGNGERAVRVKCPHCGNRIQLVEPDPREVSCASCGSSFQVLEQLGRGAFGVVYQALDPELRRPVALKVPRAGTFETPEEERFLREARSTARLQHPGIVTATRSAAPAGCPTSSATTSRA